MIPAAEEHTSPADDRELDPDLPPGDPEPGELMGPLGDAVRPIDDDPVHLARCADCGTAVKFRPNVTGTAFFLVDADPDAVFGIGPNGRPVCPNGHGEMAIADDKLPAAEAFALAADRLASDGPVQRTLPGVVPPFNYPGAFTEIVGQARTVEVLKAEYDTAKQEAADAKKALDKASELLMRMTLEFDRRRREKDEPSAAPAEPEPGPRLIKCTWEAAHPTETCPMCSGAVVEAVLSRLVGNQREATDAEAHVDEVDALLAGIEIETVVEALQDVDTFIDSGLVASWTTDERKAVTEWAERTADKRDVPDADITIPERPKVLGKPHIPAEAIDGIQHCSICDEALVRSSDPHEHYAVTDYVGTDCKGPDASGHRYPAKAKKAPKAKRG